jgi:hypothetical protein
MFSYLWTAFYVTLGTRISHERDVKTSRFGELFLRNGGPHEHLRGTTVQEAPGVTGTL